MNLDHLRYFVVASETLHTAKAGKILNVSQSTISHGIRKMEEELGQPLFESVGRRIVLTELGKQFALRARELLASSSQMLNEFRSPKLSLEGRIRIGVVHSIAHELVAPHLASLQKSQNKLTIEIYSQRSAQVIEGLISKTLDLGLCFSPTPHPDIIELAAKTTALQIAVRRNHPLAHQKMTTAKELLAFPFAAPKAFAGIEVCENHPELIRLGITQDPQLIFDSYDTAAAYLKKSEVWCMMPAMLIPTLGLVALKIKDLKASARLSLVIPKGRPLPQKIEEMFISLLTPQA